MLEEFVQARYFDGHRGEIQAHSTAQTQRGVIRFLTMFDAVAPGSYDLLYRLMSKLAHGGLSNLMFRQETTAPTEPARIMAGSEYNSFFANFVLAQAHGLAYGLLRFSPRFFPTLRTQMLAAETSPTERFDRFLADYERMSRDLPRTAEQQANHEGVVRPFLEGDTTLA